MTSKAAVSVACDHTSLDELSENANIDPPSPTINIIEAKGEFLDGGGTGFVELPDTGDVVKSPWTGRLMASVCRQQIAIEAQIYERLGVHPRLVQCKHWDPVGHVLTLEYMPNGNLKQYVQKHGQEIPPSRRQQWVREVAECVELLHSHNIIQSDVGPHNLLLDSDLSLKICDFGGSSLDGSPAMVGARVRYWLPGLDETTVQEDLFTLGSTIYFIVTGHEPYEELADEGQVERLFEDGVFPDLSDIPFAEVIALCWRQEAESAKMIVELVMRSSEKFQSSQGTFEPFLSTQSFSESEKHATLT